MIVFKALRYALGHNLKLIRKIRQYYSRTKSWSQVAQLLSSQDIIRESKYIDYIVDHGGNKYRMTELIDTVRSVREDYKFNDIRHDDIVIDIGSGIGVFSILASKTARQVYAIEPMTADLVKANIALNGIQNIQVLDIALGNGGVEYIEWKGRAKTIQTKTLGEIKRLCGGCNFLKIDCEGCEWNIKPEDLGGIRRIEMEVHTIGYPLARMEDMLTQAGYAYEITLQPKGKIGLWVIHAENKKL